ncbi:hypothetical protein GCM10011372_22290 [Agromyces bauzanensis]|uniref:Uncharacterized protein n=1 Tax=Agromyces bauzanensis TaxID=1308924 RepID=A0A917PL61_9MICO|nr:hypothetical protein GCM10011372_22290 [Agromyces bauzanensis]
MVDEERSSTGSDRLKRGWSEAWAVSNRAYAEEEERGRRRHAARQDRLRGGATSVEIRESFGRAAGRIVRRTAVAIAAGIGAVYLGRIGFTGIFDGLGVAFWANLAAIAGAIVSGLIALLQGASVVRLVMRATRHAVRAAADERGLTLVTDIEGDLPRDGGPARFAWDEVKSLARFVTYGWKEAEDPPVQPPPSPEYLVVTARDGRIVRTLVDGPREPWRRLMLIARDVGPVADVSNIDNAAYHYIDTDPFLLRFGK